MFKVAKKECPAKRIQDAIKDKPEVRPFPAAVSQLVAACQDPNANAALFEKIIGCDPALSVRLLRMANSPLCGLAKEVRTISHAVSVLGIRHLRSLALATAGSSMFSQGSSGAAARQALWNHSLGVATVARMLAKYIPSVPAEEAFLAGIFHDVGKLLLFDVVEKEYAELTAAYSGLDLINQEQLLLETTHEEIGWRSATSWGLSEAIKMAIGFHHRPADAEVHRDMVSLTHIADHLAKAWHLGSEDVPNSASSGDALDHLALDENLLADVHANAESAYQETVSAMSS
jgi:putative nucleotidyltransferase with HDIG domain